MGNKAVIATNNKHKLEEIGQMLAGYNLEILSMRDVNLDGMEIIEDGKTFEENAIIKAKTVMEKTGIISLADDSGLEVEAIENQPGIYSARFAGEHANDKANNDKLLTLLKNVPLEERKARFVCVIAVVFPNGETLTVRGECYGIIGLEAIGNTGFGYDPLFIVPELNKTFGELGSEAKNQISHRAKALEKLKEVLKCKLGE